MLQAGTETQLINVSRTTYPRAIVIFCISEGIFYVYFFTYTLSATWSGQFLQRAIAFQRMYQPVNFPTRVLNPRIWEHIYCLPQTDCFVVSQLFSVARSTRCFKLGSKPDWFYRDTKKFWIVGIRLKLNMVENDNRIEGENVVIR